MPRGKPAPIPSGKDQRSTVDGGLGDANIQKKGLSHGSMEHGTSPGQRDAVYAVLSTKQAKANYEVRHNLGRVPTGFVVWKTENRQTPGSVIFVAAVDSHKWTESTIQVYVYCIVGSLDGGEITLEIGGGR